MSIPNKKLTPVVLTAVLDTNPIPRLPPEVLKSLSPPTVLEWVKMMKVLCRLLRKMAKKARMAYLQYHGLTMLNFPIWDLNFFEHPVLSQSSILPEIVGSHITIHELYKSLQTLETLLQPFHHKKSTVYHLMVNKLGGYEDVALHIASLYAEEDERMIKFFKGFVPTPENTKIYDAFVNVHHSLWYVNDMMFHISTEYMRMHMDHTPDAIRWEKLLDFVSYNFHNNFTPLHLRQIHDPYSPGFVKDHLALIPDWIKERRFSLFPDVNNFDVHQKMGFPEYDDGDDSDGEEW